MFSDLGLYHDMDTVDKLNFYTENKEWKVMKKKHAFEKKSKQRVNCNDKGRKVLQFQNPELPTAPGSKT